MKQQHVRSFARETAIVAAGILIGAKLAAPLWDGALFAEPGRTALVPQWTAQVMADPVFLPELTLNVTE